ncbi:irregular chiasm C-roughest protein-like isoform X2 [Pectinophora gossypiella]|uniref:irregular chiasm C-roughest protein-like isoform X2 n=1 Tax=Pectinophora gossypiella TaxID=13191 RepID=UPI00214ED322|nr:irregular chiasm C-roughest protein-like isoform X2 [Pectinophora gossypiella]
MEKHQFRVKENASFLGKGDFNCKKTNGKQEETFKELCHERNQLLNENKNTNTDNEDESFERLMKDENDDKDVDQIVKLNDRGILVASIENNLKNIRNKTTSKQKKVTSRRANSLFLLLRIVNNFNMVVKLWMVMCVFCISVCAKEQRFAMEPQDQTAVVGSRVTLPCRVVNKAGQLQWTKDDFGLGTHRHLIGYDRYKMIGSDEEGDYSLDIREVTLDDDALYQCQVSSGPRGEPPIRSRYARLQVLVPPDPPKILQGPVLEAIEDREVNVECVSIGGKPAPEITWIENDGGVLTQGVTYTVDQLPDGRRYSARSILRLRPRRHHHNQTFTCQAQNTADRTFKMATVKLKVQFAPKVRVFVKTRALNSKIQEGDTISVGCQATANPNNLTYRWYINNDPIVGSAGNEMIITNVTRKYNEATVKCEVHNAVGKSADTKTLEVTYGPTFISRPENVEGEAGSTATLKCLVNGHPQPKVLWLRYDNERVIRVGKSPNLTLTISAHTAGQYWCRASVENYQDIEASAMVYLKGPPKILSNQTQYGVEGDSVRIECVSFSVPKPDYVMWTFGGMEINSFHNQEYAFLEETLTDRMMKSTLIIRESQTRHFGTYNCSVSNLYGTDSIEIRLLPDKTFPIILIISACASAAILVLIIMLIIMLCHRRTRMSDEKKPDITDVGKTCVDQFKDSDRSSNISDLKMELRQVEGSCDMDHSNGGSDTELHSTLHLTTNLGLPLAGPVPLPDAGYDNELMKQYQRYSGDFNQPINNLNFKLHGQSNGYVPYVDYARDYVPPGDSLTGSLTRSTGSTFPSHCGSLNRQASCGRLAGLAGPDVIPMANPGVVVPAGVDIRYAATYGNPYLRGSGPLFATSGSSPSSSSSSRPVTSPMPSSSSTNSGAQPQVPKTSPSSGALYILPNQGSSQITTKGSGSQTTGTHV